MFRRDADPIANIPVYKRIALGSDPQPSEPQPSWMEVYFDAIEAAQLQTENDRIWRCVVDTASGTNAPVIV